MRAILPIVAMLLASPAFAQAPAVDIAPFLAHEINPKVHLLTTPDDWYAAAIGNVVLIEQSDGFVVVDLTGAVTGGQRCTEASRALIRRIANRPGRYYVNVHNPTYPDGAIQGPLHRP